MDKANKIGFLFPKTSKAGKRYYSGKVTINGIEKSVVGFDSKSKSGSLYISLSESMPYEKVPQKSTSQTENVISPDDLPF